MESSLSVMKAFMAVSLSMSSRSESLEVGVKADLLIELVDWAECSIEMFDKLDLLM